MIANILHTATEPAGIRCTRPDGYDAGMIAYKVGHPGTWIARPRKGPVRTFISASAAEFYMLAMDLEARAQERERTC